MPHPPESALTRTMTIAALTLLLCGAGILLPFHGPILAFIKVPRYFPYMVSLMLGLCVAFSLDPSFEKRSSPLPLKLLRAALYGYVASLIAMEVADLTLGNFVEKTLNSFHYPWATVVVGIFGYPLLILGWLYGVALGGILIALHSKRGMPPKSP